MPTLRLTARDRLTILYTALVLAAGVGLTALIYVLLRRNPGPSSVHFRINGVESVRNLPPSGELADIAKQVRDETLAEFLTQAATALTVVTVLAAVTSWLVAGRVLRPIRAISATAQRLSAENLSERVPVNAPRDELTALADTINGMLDRIQHSIAERERMLDSQRMFTANAAHELRTPLTTMRTAIDVTLDGEPTRAELLAMTSDIGTAVAHSQRTLDGLLVLARSQSDPGRRRPVDLADVAAGALDSVADNAAAAEVALHTDLRPAPVSGEPVLLERMTSNLIDNAVRYNHASGHISVRTGTEAAQAVLRITNTGPPVPPDAAPNLLEPFARGNGSRTHTDGGIGLGLSIVRAVAIAHDGEVSVTARPAGGLDVTVCFPLA